MRVSGVARSSTAHALLLTRSYTRVLLYALLLVAALQPLAAVTRSIDGLNPSASQLVRSQVALNEDDHDDHVTDHRSDTEPVQDALEMLPGWSQRAVGPSARAFELPTSSFELRLVGYLYRPAGRTEAPPVPPPLSNF